jgi:hypothetical protein
MWGLPERAGFSMRFNLNIIYINLAKEITKFS